MVVMDEREAFSEEQRMRRREIARRRILQNAQAALAPELLPEQLVVNQARTLANKLNREIEKGNDTFAFGIALIIAIFKDATDIILDLLGVGEIPGVTFLVGMFLTTFMFFFMLGKGWFLTTRLRIWYWVLGLFVDNLPLFNALPINTLLVLYAWRLTKKRAANGKLVLGTIGDLSNKQVDELNKDISLLEKSHEEMFRDA